MKHKIASLGQIIQIAYVASDFDHSIKFWTETMGVGPFYLMKDVHKLVSETHYLSKKSAVEYSLALSYWGEMQIEIIQQHNDAPSIYADWLRESRKGIQHFCIYVADINDAIATCQDQQGTILQQVYVEGGGAIYVDLGAGCETILEIVQQPPGQRELFAMIKDATRDWDGAEPLRAIG